MLAIKLQRIGKKHQPGFRIVVAEKRSKLGAPPVDDLGFYNPQTKAVSVSKEKVERWLKIGAKATATVNNLLVKKSIISGSKVAIKMKKAKVSSEIPAVQASSPEKPEKAAEPAEDKPAPAAAATT